MGASTEGERKIRFCGTCLLEAECLVSEAGGPTRCPTCREVAAGEFEANQKLRRAVPGLTPADLECLARRERRAEFSREGLRAEERRARR